jgi:thioredoxin-dependent peroxiredoxin
MGSRIAAGLFLAGVIAVPALAQNPAPPAASQPLEVGATAPDFTLSGATRYGVLKSPVHLSDFRDKTVVIAFFYRARTRG